MMKRFLPFLVCLLVAAGSFAYGRHHYVQNHSVTLMNPFNHRERANVTSPLADTKLFGDWVQEEWLFALVLPAALLAVGATLALKQ